MKRCGQWLSLLWVSATWVWMQTPAGTRLATETGCARLMCPVAIGLLLSCGPPTQA